MSKSYSRGAFSFIIGGMLGIATLGIDVKATEHEDKDVLVCYKWSAFPNERLKLNIEHHSRLTEEEEERQFDHSRQVAFSVHGKEIGGCGGDTMGTVTGTIVTANDRGAHMGLAAHFSRGNGQLDFCRSFTFDCTSKEDGPAPDTWQCQSRNEFDVYHGISELQTVDAREDPRCSAFENGTFSNAQAQFQRGDLGPELSAGSPMRPFANRAAMIPGGQSGGEDFMPELRANRRALGSAASCYSDYIANGVGDSLARFFCGLRPGPPWLLELDPRVLR